MYYIFMHFLPVSGEYSVELDQFQFHFIYTCMLYLLWIIDFVFLSERTYES